MSGSRIRAVVFDLDDTLFDHRESAHRGAMRIVQELGAADADATEIVSSWERTAEQLMERRLAGEIDRDEYRHLRVRHLLRDIGREGEAAELDGGQCDRLYARYLAVYEEEWVAFADVPPRLASSVGAAAAHRDPHQWARAAAAAQGASARDLPVGGRRLDQREPGCQET